MFIDVQVVYFSDGVGERIGFPGGYRKRLKVSQCKDVRFWKPV